jgi:glycosyltransferase involved in cell wall biosynthesis
MAKPRISFGMIVLNGEPFIRYNLGALYPFAHQIIVVEGAAPGATAIAGSDGHSTDGTLETLKAFKSTEDPEEKITILTAEDEGYEDGFWPGEKHEQSQAYARRATGDYLWQVDVDEFYMPEGMERIIEMLQTNPSITAVSFPMLTFWGSIHVTVDGWYLRRGASQYHRLFKWGPSHRYATHRPPTVVDGTGRDLRKLNWICAGDLEKERIYLYHYSLLFPRQVFDKCAYYQEAGWARRKEALRWMETGFLSLKRPYHVHNVYDFPSWLETYEDDTPPQVIALWRDVKGGRIQEEIRPMEDAKRLLSSFSYRLGRGMLRILDYVERPFHRWILALRRRLPGFLKRISGSSRASRP